MYQQHIHVTEIKETYFEINTKQEHVHWLSSFKHLKLPISIKIPVTIWQRTSDTLIGYLPIFKMLFNISLCIRYPWHHFEKDA